MSALGPPPELKSIQHMSALGPPPELKSIQHMSALGPPPELKSIQHMSALGPPPELKSIIFLKRGRNYSASLRRVNDTLRYSATPQGRVC